jgi:hypothetical protein
MCGNYYEHIISNIEQVFGKSNKAGVHFVALSLNLISIID